MVILFNLQDENNQIKTNLPEDPEEKEQVVPPFLLLKINKQPTRVEVAIHLFAEINVESEIHITNKIK